MNNKVSEKAIWEDSITPDNETSSLGTHIQPQSQMMFCYKCNNIIPSNSKFCPCCNVVLFATCPKCGVKYSSQYLICNQCGTDRLEYLQLQMKEQERIAATELEERLRKEKLERKRREELERQEREAAAKLEQRLRKEELERKQREKLRQQQWETFQYQNAQIKNTKEYQSTYSILKEALESTRWKHTLCVFDTNMREHFIRKYISKKGCDYDQYMLDHILNRINCSFYQFTYDVLNNLSELCITAYRDKNGMPKTYDQ